MIKHKEIKHHIDLAMMNRYLSTGLYFALEQYIEQQEKKDKLLELYKALHNTYRYPTWNLVEEVKYVLEEIKLLEEEMK